MPAKEAKEEDGPVLGHLSMTIVTRVHEPLYGGGMGTIGEAVNEFLGKAAADGREVMDVKFEMSPEQWHGMAPRLAQQHRNRG